MKRVGLVRSGGSGALVLAAVVAVALPLPGTDPPPTQSAPPPPNVVVLMTDDQTTSDMRVMPLTRRLIGDAGASFANSVVSYPLCCPSRATLLTGRYAHNHHVLAQEPPLGGYGRLDGENALPVWLRAAGYHTIHIGKFLNGYGVKRPHEVPPGWSEWRGSIDPTTYRYWGYTLNENGNLVTYGRSNPRNPGVYQTDVYARKAEEAIRRRAGKGAFFLSVAFLAPHTQGPGAAEAGPLPAPRDAGRFANRPLPHPPAFNERDVSDKPPFLRRERLGAGRISAITRRYRNRLESLIAVDEAVAGIVRALRDTGQLSRTFLLFTSDNGLFHGEHRIKTNKFFAYDPASRVPLLLRGPGIPHGVVSDELVANVDLAPTIVAVSGVTASKRMDGRSLLPYALDPGLLTRRPILHEAGAPQPPIAGEPAAPPYKAIRTRRWLFVRWPDGVKELYDLKHDPDELRSLHADPRYGGVRGELSRQLDRLATCGGGICRHPRPTVPAP